MKKEKGKRKKCYKCRKKLTLTTTYECSCNQIFCSNHRYKFEHDCEKILEDKNKQKNEISKENPIIKKDPWNLREI